MTEGSGPRGNGEDDAVPLRVLLAEDNPVNQRITQVLVERMGHLVDTASDGFEAVEAVARTPYDVVLMDVQMPGLDGLAATRAIRSRDSEHPRPLIVALTGSGQPDDRAACRSAGMDAFLSKPLTVVALGAVFGAVLTGAVTGGPDVGAGSSDDAAAASRKQTIERRFGELAGPDPDDADLDLFSDILRSFIARSPGLVEELAEAVRRSAVTAVEFQAHRLKGSAANLGGQGLVRLLDDIESQSRLGQDVDDRDLQPVRAELAELRRSLASVANALESRSRNRPTAVPKDDDPAGGAQ